VTGRNARVQQNPRAGGQSGDRGCGRVRILPV